jgi:hypothetical protein
MVARVEDAREDARKVSVCIVTPPQPPGQVSTIPSAPVPPAQLAPQGSARRQVQPAALAQLAGRGLHE